MFWKLVENATSHPITFPENWFYALQTPSARVCERLTCVYVSVCVCVCVCVCEPVSMRDRGLEKERMIIMKVSE